jgi:hypothetical protein
METKLVIKFGSYLQEEFWQFSVGVSLWRNKCFCHAWCLIIDLGFWYIEVSREKL